MSQKANERNKHRSPAHSNHHARHAIIIDARSSHARGRGQVQGPQMGESTQEGVGGNL